MQQQEKAKQANRQGHNGKKFSWKAYPELEDFFIRNREEYLSYSAKNYTIEQRDYNNRLTARLLDHAKDSGYPELFENSAFASVRDRIRSYYKSYVQSFKRRRERQQRQQQLKQKQLVQECREIEMEQQQAAAAALEQRKRKQLSIAVASMIANGGGGGN